MKEKDIIFYQQEWPAHYYEIEDINQREEVLKEMLKESPDSPEDLRRLEILQKRFGKVHTKNRPDRFMHAMLMIREMYDIRINPLNERRKQAEFIQYADELLIADSSDDILQEEYRDLIRKYIKVTYKSFSRPAFLGMGRRTEDKVHDAVEEDLHIILKGMPSKFHYQDKFEIIYSIADEELKNLK